jgi:hypothetical protein
MDIFEHAILFSDSELKEIFALFSSGTKYEREQIYDPTSEHYFEQVDLAQEYELHEEKRECALDAVRGVLYFLHRAGYKLEKGGEVKSIESINGSFI